MSISSIPQTAHKLGMAGKLTQPRAPQTAITLVLGFGQTVAFASSFYLLGVLGDVIATDLALSPTFVFSLMSVALAVTPLVAATAALVGVAAVSVRFAEFTVMRRFSPLIATRVATLMHPLGAACLLTLGARGASLMALGHGAGSGMTTVAKGVLPLHLYGPANYAYRSALLSRPAQLVQIGGPALYGFALAESPRMALALSAGLCLVMFSMTFGLERRLQPQKEEAAA